MIPIILFFFLFLINAQDSDEVEQVIDNSFFSVNNNTLYRIFGYAEGGQLVPSDVYAGSLDDYLLGSAYEDDIRQLTLDFFQAFAAEEVVLDEIMLTYVSENEDARVLWTIQSWVPALGSLTNIRIGTIHEINKQYTAMVRLMGEEGTTTIRILYELEANGWKIVDIEGDLRQLLEPHTPVPFVPADVQAPLPGF